MQISRLKWLLILAETNAAYCEQQSELASTNTLHVVWYTQYLLHERYANMIRQILRESDESSMRGTD